MPYEIRIYSSDDDSALHLGSITMTPREMLDIQRVLMSYADKFNDDGLPVSFRPEFQSEDVYQKMLQQLSENRETVSGVRAAAEEEAAIKQVVYGVPYEDDFQPWTGFYASSVLTALTESAFEKCVLPTQNDGTDLPVDVQFRISDILTEEEHTREQVLQDMSTFAICKNAFGDQPMTAANVRLAQFSKNIVIIYDLLENQPRRVDVNDVQFTNEKPGTKLNAAVSAYYDSSSWVANHEITVIWWYDDYPKENFLTQLSSNGAWLARNNW